MSDLMLDVGQANEFKLACRREGLDNEDIKFLCDQKGLLAYVRNVRRGLMEFKNVEHAVDFSADPFLPDGWNVEKHQKGKVAKLERRGDNLYIDGKKIELWLSKSQKKGNVIGGNDLRKEVAKLSVPNVNLLDYLLKNPHLIPESWKKDENGNTRYIFFWGTIYRYSDGRLSVRCLYWHVGAWRWSHDWLDHRWNSRSPAAVLVIESADSPRV